MYRVERLQTALRRCRPRSREAYSLAAALVAEAEAPRIALGPAMAGVEFITLFPAVLATTLLCGIEVGFVSVTAGVIATNYIITTPNFPASVAHARIPPSAFFAIIATPIVVLVGAMRAAIDGACRENDISATAREAAPPTDPGHFIPAADAAARAAEKPRPEESRVDEPRVEEPRVWLDAFNFSAIGIEISDPLDGIVRIVNPTYAADRGMTVEEARGRHVFDAYATDEHPRLPGLLATADRDGRVTFEASQRRKDGSNFPLRTDLVSVRDADGALLYRVATSRDISEPRRADSAIRHTQKVEAIGRLAAGVSHDFNNLLQSIMGGLELVLDDLPADTRAREFAELALKSAERGAVLARHLLAYARKQVLFPVVIDLAEDLGEFQARMARSVGPDIVVEMSVAADTPPVFVDQGQLRTALLNLGINAAHAMPQGGTLTVAARAGTDGDADRVIISLTDTGSGMDEATLANATDPFFSTKGLAGSGLGLSMVKGFVEQSGGDLRIASQPGAGTTVELRLPLAAAIAAPSVAALRRLTSVAAELR